MMNKRLLGVLVAGLIVGAAGGWWGRVKWHTPNSGPDGPPGTYQIVPDARADQVWRLDTRTGRISACKGTELGTVGPVLACIGPAEELEYTRKESEVASEPYSLRKG